MRKNVGLCLVIGVCLAFIGQASADTYMDNIVFRSSSAQWFLSHNQGSPDYYAAPPASAPVTSSATFGLVGTGDVPMVGDVNGDGFDDIIINRPGGNFNWYAAHTIDTNADYAGELTSAADSSLAGFGTVAGSSGNFLADINADGCADALTINAGFNWYANSSSAAGLGTGPTQGPVQYGGAGDQPIVGDFNGDGQKDIGVYRPSGGNVLTNFTGAGGVLGGGGIGPAGQIGGGATDSLLIGNLNGDAYDDAVMVRQTGAGLITWYGLINDGTGKLDYFNDGTTIVSFGIDGTDVPFLTDINGDGLDDIGINRSGAHYVAFTTAGGALGTNAAGDEVWNFGLADDIQLFGDFNIVPEPTSLLLLGLAGLMLRRR